MLLPRRLPCTWLSDTLQTQTPLLQVPLLATSATLNPHCARLSSQDGVHQHRARKESPQWLHESTTWHASAAGVIAGIVSYIIINGVSYVLDLAYKRMGWTIKGPEDYSLEKPDLSLHKAELSTELAGGPDDSASGAQLKRKQSTAPLTDNIEDSSAFYAGVSCLLVCDISTRCSRCMLAWKL